MKHALFETNKGNFLVELNDEKAPITVANFLKYVNRGHYDGTIFHRVINGFMVQGGGMEPGLKQKPTDEPITNEADNGLTNDPYTIAMARTNDPHSASAQFFVNVNKNDFLNHTTATAQGWGYAVFGRVTSGQDVIDAIRQVKTGSKGFHQDVPLENVIVTRAFESDAEGNALGEPAESEEEYQARLAQEAEARALGRQKGAVITRHLVEGAATDVLISVGDDPNPVTGANYRYEFSGFDTAENPSAGEFFPGQRMYLHLLFQNGNPAEHGQNGVTLEALLAVCSHRLQGFQDGPFNSADNQEAMEHIDAAIAALNRRTIARIAREVEGTQTV